MPAILGATAAAATDLGYLILIRRQGPPYEWGRVTIVAAIILAGAGLVLTGALARRPEIACRTLSAGLIVLLGLAVVGMFSIGPPLLVAVLLTAWGIGRTNRVIARR